MNVEVTIQNTGNVAGKEVAQVYVSAPKNKQMDKPVKELKGFAKTRLLQPGESETLRISIPRSELASWNEATHEWQVDNGTYTLILSTILFCAVATLMATAQTAYWITADDSLRNAPNTWMEFRKDFTLKKKPRKVEARIAADSKYWLWVNGTLAVFEGGLKRGPNRTDTYYDVVDLAPCLRKGQNDVRLLLCYFGKAGFSHVSSGQAGVIVDAPTIGLVTDASWQSQRLQAYQTCGAPYTNFRLAESNIRFDARMKGQNNLKPSLEIGVWGEGTWGKLAERPIPQWRDYGMKIATKVDTTIVAPSGAEGGASEASVVLSVRLPYNMQMTPWIDVTDETDGTCIRLETDHAWGGSAECVRAEYVTRQGRQQYESLGWMNGDVLRIIYPKSARLTVHGIG